VVEKKEDGTTKYENKKENEKFSIIHFQLSIAAICPALRRL